MTMNTSRRQRGRSRRPRRRSARRSAPEQQPRSARVREAHREGRRKTDQAVSASDAETHLQMMVPKGGLEPPRIAPYAPQAYVSTNSTTSATWVGTLDPGRSKGSVIINMRRRDRKMGNDWPPSSAEEQSMSRRARSRSHLQAALRSAPPARGPGPPAPPTGSRVCSSRSRGPACPGPRSSRTPRA